jgi:dihydroorotase
MKKGTKITVPAMFDPHFHLREGDGVMRDLLRLAYLAGVSTVGTMPNVGKGLLTAESVVNYRQKARASVNNHEVSVPCVDIFMPIGAINEDTTLDELELMYDAGIRSVKVYPLGRTTNSDFGVRDYFKLLPLVTRCGELGITVHFHPENPNMLFEDRDAEFQFISFVDQFIRLTKAKIVWEHGTDARCIPYWKEWSKTGRFFVTFTPHHLLTNESDSRGDVRAEVKPRIKTCRDQNDLVKLVLEDHDWVMAGSDSAWHPCDAKHTDEGQCACGAFHGRHTLALYAHALLDRFIYESMEDSFDCFIFHNAKELHGLDIERVEITLVREETKIEKEVLVDGNPSMLFWAGKTINWRVER